MAENHHQKYSYQEMSNKVEQADRSLLRSRASEPTGEVESLRGRTDIGRMGDRLAGETQKNKGGPSELREKVQRKKQKRGEPQESNEGGTAGAGGRRDRTAIAAASGGQTILDFDNLTGYQPTTQTARVSYEKLLVRHRSAALSHTV
jgi:pre-mRNA-splicing helicase BRR2